MNIVKTPIEGLLVIEPKVWVDERGYFLETFHQNWFKELDIQVDFVQDNQSFSNRGVLRGLHCQAAPYAQGKLVRVIKGEVVDIAVDIRENSPTYGQHFSIHLSEENKKLVWVPPGFLHGFITLKDETIFTYKVSNYYHKESEVGVIWNDKTLNIDWILSESELIISDKDKNLGTFDALKK
jgi:dTDP-4-dehydrorhamnose 3,5-epimerase